MKKIAQTAVRKRGTAGLHVVRNILTFSMIALAVLVRSALPVAKTSEDGGIDEDGDLVFLAFDCEDTKVSYQTIDLIKPADCPNPVGYLKLS